MAMTDRRLAQLGRMRDEASKAEKDSKAKRQELDAKIIAELDRRGTKTITAMGVKVTKSAQTRKWYDWDYLAERLPAKQMRRIQKRAVDNERLAEALQDNSIDAAVIAGAMRSTVTEPYTSVSFPGM